MEKITESVLLGKGSLKGNKLEKITRMNLSSMGLKDEDLSATKLNKLSALEELNLSGNRIQSLPAGLCLPRLRVLNLSNNDMEEVTSLETLVSLEELHLDGNLYLTVSDEHKVMFLLPKLKILNGKDISMTANHVRNENTKILWKRVTGVWEKNFTLPDPPTSKSLVELKKKFVNAACLQIKYGPSSLNNFTKWRVGMIAEEYLKSLIDPERQEENTMAETPVKDNARTIQDLVANGDAENPRKRRMTNQRVSSCKSSQLASSPPVETCPRKSSRLQGISQKIVLSVSSPSCENMNTSEASPRKSSRLQNTSISAEEAAVAVTPTAKTTKNTLQVQFTTPQAYIDTKAQAIWNVPKEPVSLQPLHVLQCHSKNDSPDDFSTQLWACAFEPTHNNSNAGAWAHSVATCGGETVCVIDCESGLVLKKYKVPGEEFFTLSWTTVLMSREGGNARSCNILAAGGKKGVVRLIHPKANLAYGEFRASHRAIATLRFSPHQPNFLFTGAYDKKIVMWDIGGLDRDYNFKSSQLLIMEANSTPLQLCLPPCSSDTHLIAGCDNGLYSYDIQPSKNKQKRAEEMEVVFPVYKKGDKNKTYRTIDGLSFLSDDVIASKSHMQGSIYLWSWSATRALLKPGRKAVPAVILTELEWSNTNTPYLSLNTCPGFGYVMCGDDQGQLWTYHIPKLEKVNFKSGKAAPATEVLEWPSPVRKGAAPIGVPCINSVGMDPELHYLVALSDKNMVVIWKRASAP